MAVTVPTIDREAFSRVIAVESLKGGVGKTTIVANVGGYLALSGARVLLVDLDPQGNLEVDLGYVDDERNDEGESLAKALMFGGEVDALTNVRENLDVWAGGSALHNVTAALSSKMGSDPLNAKLALARILAPVVDDYDFIFLDCPPGDGVLQLAALAAARWVLVPSRTGAKDIAGVVKVAERIDQVLDVNKTIDLLGVVLFAVGTASARKDGTVVMKNAERAARDDLDRLFGVGEEDGIGRDIVFRQAIRHSEAVASQAGRGGLLVHELDERAKEEAKAGIAWWKIRSGELKNKQLTSATAGSVADDLQTIAQEINDRLLEAENAVLEGANA
ncbi:ParA family protein [Microbacterium sediminis]|uniref:ParA family protein n=1 Tax=Microbacterium sediminis TaxID=904291 RepID=UPI0010721513|nr:ParA family protein [Microbacterium sediminis]QBR75593.1 ParA family protein [Microbacterium sediminis]